MSDTNVSKADPNVVPEGEEANLIQTLAVDSKALERCVETLLSRKPWSTDLPALKSGISNRKLDINVGDRKYCLKQTDIHSGGNDYETSTSLSIESPGDTVYISFEVDGMIEMKINGKEFLDTSAKRGTLNLENLRSAAESIAGYLADLQSQVNSTDTPAGIGTHTVENLKDIM